MENENEVNEVEVQRQQNFMKAKIFFEQKIQVHVLLKNGIFYNGFIMEEPSTDFFFVDDREDGRKLIFFIELFKPIEEYYRREE